MIVWRHPCRTLNLPDYRDIAVDETDDAYHIAAETLVAPTMCSHCDGVAIVGYGRNSFSSNGRPT